MLFNALALGDVDAKRTDHLASGLRIYTQCKRHLIVQAKPIISRMVPLVRHRLSSLHELRDQPF